VGVERQTYIQYIQTYTFRKTISVNQGGLKKEDKAKKAGLESNRKNLQCHLTPIAKAQVVVTEDSISEEPPRRENTQRMRPLMVNN